MTPAARIAAVIELLALADRETGLRATPLDRLVRQYFRKRRYAGAKDRRAITDILYAVVRRLGPLDWLAGISHFSAQTTDDERARARLLVHFALEKEDVRDAFSGTAYAPSPLGPAENRLFQSLIDNDEPFVASPRHVRFNVPEWLLAMLDARFGDASEQAIRALDKRAPLTLRVNTLKARREQVLPEIEGAIAGHWTPESVEATTALALNTVPAYREGRVEIQDEASQLATWLADVKPGMKVAELGAGGGGKTLALAARMGNEGRIHACDISGARLAELERRVQRAGVRIATTHLGAPPREMRRACDRVFIDAPCSGSGTWRRNPLVKWRLTVDDLTELARIQSELLEQGADLLKTGGRMIYATCSLLQRENEDRITAFLKRFPGFCLRPWDDIWKPVLPIAPPAENLSQTPQCLQLAPHAHGTDGFFLAILEKHDD